MEESRNDHQMIGRFYTSARRFKEVLGSLPDGTKIPGGPYTYAQIGFMIGTLVLGWMTRALWGTDSAIGDLIILLAIAVGLGYLLGKMPASRRNPLKLLGSALVLLTHPRPGGNWRGRPLKMTIRAQKIQTDAKKKARFEAETTKRTTTHEEECTPEIPLGTAEFGSSLNRLLIDNGLMNTEREK